MLGCGATLVREDDEVCVDHVRLDRRGRRDRVGRRRRRCDGGGRRCTVAASRVGLADEGGAADTAKEEGHGHDGEEAQLRGAALREGAGCLGTELGAPGQLGPGSAKRARARTHAHGSTSQPGRDVQWMGKGETMGVLLCRIKI